MITLRDYQTTVIEKLDAEITAGRKRILLIAPTGSGKDGGRRRNPAPRERTPP
jgi:type I site-specific restriction endonuclease